MLAELFEGPIALWPQSITTFRMRLPIVSCGAMKKLIRVLFIAHNQEKALQVLESSFLSLNHESNAWHWRKMSRNSA